MANSVDPAQIVFSGSTLFASILNSSVMLGNYLQQTTSADDIFRCIFFLALLGFKIKWSRYYLPKMIMGPINGPMANFPFKYMHTLQL